MGHQTDITRFAVNLTCDGTLGLRAFGLNSALPGRFGPPRPPPLPAGFCTQTGAAAAAATACAWASARGCTTGRPGRRQRPAGPARGDSRPVRAAAWVRRGMGPPGLVLLLLCRRRRHLHELRHYGAGPGQPRPGLPHPPRYRPCAVVVRPAPAPPSPPPAAPTPAAADPEAGSASRGRGGGRRGRQGPASRRAGAGRGGRAQAAARPTANRQQPTTLLRHGQPLRGWIRAM